MIKYNIFVTPEAYDDINNIYDFIYYNYHAPITAKRYIEGLYKKLKSLSACAGSFKTETRLSIVNRLFGVLFIRKSLGIANYGFLSVGQFKEFYNI